MSRARDVECLLVVLGRVGRGKGGLAADQGLGDGDLAFSRSTCHFAGMKGMRGATGSRPRAGLAALAACALLLQTLGALLPSAGSAAALPFGALVICTPEGIRVLGPDGAPLEAPEEGVPASAADPCQLCCLSRACCQGLPALSATAAFAPARALSYGRQASAAPHRLFPLAQPGRGPPPDWSPTRSV